MRWDIFCAVIDNYGDAGVCWRLARQLAAEYGFNVRLWIDDLTALQRMHPALHLDRDEQMAAGVCVRRWPTSMRDVVPAEVVIEAFGCEVPAIYIAAMQESVCPPLWINLEYLSAETWVEDCHALPSPQPSGLLKYFFFPGFTAKTGGLLREKNLLAKRRVFQTDPRAQQLLLARCGVERSPETLLVSLFAYEQVPIAQLFEAFSLHRRPVLCVIPESKVVSAAARYFGLDNCDVGVHYRRGALTAVVIPFMTQDEYDQLLWSCDLNCVRGEDSFVRAQWAGRPLLWQIYPQQEGAHRPKLDAFLTLYRENLPAVADAALTAAWHAWNGDGAMVPATTDLLHALPLLRAHAERWADRFDRCPHLAARLAQFCANQV